MPLADCPGFGTIGLPSFNQTWSVMLAADSSTTSTSFVDLMSLSAQTSGGLCLVVFSVSGNNASTNTNVFFVLTLDGVYVHGTKFRQDTGSGAPASLVCEVAPAAGTHTFAIQWAVSAGTARVRPATVTEEHATLFVSEMNR